MKLKKPVVYAFIDSHNLNLGVQSQGWKIDRIFPKLLCDFLYYIIQVNVLKKEVKFKVKSYKASASTVGQNLRPI